ncbi:MAG: hypothetical protein L0Z53_15775 [Acidobacteriales bacterium]|nr:hypothetical protein [Terriglobales bacterium]
MNGESTNRMQCAEFEAVLAEAVEGRLGSAQDAEFRSHAQSCAVCEPMLADALAGFELLHSLDQVQPPQRLAARILIATIGASHVRSDAARVPFRERLRHWVLPVLTPMMQPRIAGSLAMTFFSLTLILGLAGFKVSDLRNLDLRPSAIRQGITRGYYEGTAKVAKYYDSMRLVYQLQAGFRDLKNQFTPSVEQEQPEQQQPSEEKKEKDDKDITRRPQPKREHDAYSQRGETMNLADVRSTTGPNATLKRREA